MKKETVLLVTIVLIVGLLVGILISKGGRESRQTQAVAPQAASVNVQQKVGMLEDLLAKDPSNRNAWVKLGHTYFDSNQPIKAMEAYDKALELDPNDPNVLTDQGVMFRKLGWYDRAVENFTKAQEIDPAHEQSLFNLGVVYRYDLQNFAGAKEAWSKFLERNPTGPAAEQVRGELEFLKSHPNPPRNR